MKQEDKELLLKDLCARLPYGVKVNYNGLTDYIVDVKLMTTHFVEKMKPYLRPMSSMTEEEKVEYCDLQDKFLLSSQYLVTDAYELFDWLNAHHFDFRNLIDKGLAIDCTNLNID